MHGHQLRTSVDCSVHLLACSRGDRLQLVLLSEVAWHHHLRDWRLNWEARSVLVGAGRSSHSLLRLLRHVGLMSSMVESVIWRRHIRSLSLSLLLRVLLVSAHTHAVLVESLVVVSTIVEVVASRSLRKLPTNWTEDVLKEIVRETLE